MPIKVGSFGFVLGLVQISLLCTREHSFPILLGLAIRTGKSLVLATGSDLNSMVSYPSIFSYGQLGLGDERGECKLIIMSYKILSFSIIR